MNKAQTSLLRWLDSEWAKHRNFLAQSSGRDARLAMYSCVTGRAITSSKDLTNDELTDIKRHVLALVQPANFTAQMKSQNDNDPAMIRLALIKRCMEGARVLKPDDELDCQPGYEDDRRSSYLANWSAKLGKDYRLMDNVALRQFVGVVEARAEKRRNKDAAKAVLHGEENDGNPF
jgi:hypothetical protein